MRQFIADVLDEIHYIISSITMLIAKFILFIIGIVFNSLQVVLVGKTKNKP
jgi:hypothetical protein